MLEYVTHVVSHGYSEDELGEIWEALTDEWFLLHEDTPDAMQSYFENLSEVIQASI